MLYTADGPSDAMLSGGTLPDTLAVINFGAGDGIEKQFANFAKFRQNVPRMSGEYWIGWFDHWGAKHQTVKPETVAKGVEWMLENKISFSLYMFHGGTSFGFMNGANTSRTDPYQPDTSSYDYDSPLDEAGRPTPKYYALRDVIKKYLPAGETLPEVPATRDLIEIPAFDLKETTGLMSLLGKPVRSGKPMSMESIGQNYGYVLYRKKLVKAFSGELKFDSLRDYGLIYVDGKAIGTIDRRLKQNAVTINAKEGSTLDILVENNGRLNFGREFNLDRKGIIGDVWLGGESLKDWGMFGLPLTDLSALKSKKDSSENDFPKFYRGSFNLTATGDTFLDTTSLGKGFVWINGHNLGRFWKIGPQQTLFVPEGWLKKGKNDVIALDVATPRKATLRGVKNQIFENQ
jgi:beta-galactosidase